MAVFDEFFFDFPEDVDVDEADRYTKAVYFHKARQLCKNKNIDIKKVSTLEKVIDNLNNHDSSFIASYEDGTILQIIVSTKENPVELDCLDNFRDDNDEIDYDHITSLVVDSMSSDELENVNAIPNMFLVLTKPEKKGDRTITNKNILEVTLPVIINDNDESAFFNIRPEKRKDDNYSIYRLFPDVSVIVSGIMGSVYEYNKENGTISHFNDGEEDFDDDDFDEQ